MCRLLLTSSLLFFAFACASTRPYSAPRACMDISQMDAHHAAFVTVMERGWRLLTNDEKRGVVDAIEATDDRNRRVHWTFFIARPLIRVRRTVESRDDSHLGAPWVSSSMVRVDYDFAEEEAVLAEVADRAGAATIESCRTASSSLARNLPAN